MELSNIIRYYQYFQWRTHPLRMTS
jgi:hypothetical protein